MFALVCLGVFAARTSARELAAPHAPRAMLHAPSTAPEAVSSRADDEPHTFDEALAALDADRAERRAAGQRWLTRALELANGPRLRAALAHASPELRGRVVDVLASADAGCELAVQLTLDADAGLARAGHDALVERLVRWSPGWAELPATRGQVLARLNETPGELCALDARRAAARPDLALGVLARANPVLPPLVLAPGARSAATAAARREPLTGLASTLVGALAREHGLALAGFDVVEPLPRDAHPWVLLQAGGAQADTSELSAVELVAGWFTLAARAETPHELRRDAARALGACGAPAALAWLEQRWSASSEPRELAWLDGILAAVDRDVVAPRLRDAREQRWLYAYCADAALEPRPALRRERASAIARALAAAGPRTTDGAEAELGVPLPAVTDALAQWVRFVVWERRTQLGADAAAFLDARIAELGRGAQPELAPLLLQALRARAATRVDGAVPLALERPEPAFEWASRTGRVAPWTRALVSSGCAPPARWDDPAAVPVEWPHALRACVLAWQLAAGRPAEHARHLAAFVARPTGGDADRAVRERLFALRTLAFADAQGVLARALAELAAREPFADAASWAVALDDGGAELAQRVAKQCSAREPLDALSAAVLGARVARGDEGARARLVRALATPAESRAAAVGVAWAVERLRDAADGAGERELVLAVRSLGRGGGAELAGLETLTAGAAPEPQALDAEDRELPAELP